MLIMWMLQHLANYVMLKDFMLDLISKTPNLIIYNIFTCITQ